MKLTHAEPRHAYRAIHDDVWPEMRDALTRHGWHHDSLFLRDDGLLIGHVETPDFERAVAGMQTEPTNAKWQTQVRHLFAALASEAADTSIQPIPCVFQLP
ncbi:MAG: L-rhamnose mutarotase [Planctomycetota bacterium]